jgi:colicin import membrane protein
VIVRRSDSIRGLGLSCTLHAVAIALLTLSVSFSEVVAPPPAKSSAMTAIAVDAAAVDKEIERLRAADAAKRQAQERTRREAENEKRKIRELKQERERLAREKAAEEERLKVAADKRKAEEAERARTEAERKKVAEQKRKDEVEKKRKEQQARRQRELQEQMEAEENAARAAEQARQDDSLIARIAADIAAAVQNAFINPTPSQQLSCRIFVRMLPGGEVADVKIVQSSGNEIFDRQAEAAVKKASPLPVPGDPRLFEKVREINFIFTPEG